VPISASRTRETTAPTVAASLRAGTTRLTCWPVVALRSNSADSDQSSQWCVRRRNQPSRPSSSIAHALLSPVLLRPAPSCRG
jgi:hypothetical protein